MKGKKFFTVMAAITLSLALAGCNASDADNEIGRASCRERV